VVLALQSLAAFASRENRKTQMKALLVGLVATLTTGCVASAGYGYSTGIRHGSVSSVPPPPASPGGVEVAPAYGPGEDLHWFSADDYLIAPAGHLEKVQRVRVAKMTEPPTPGSRGEARFLVNNGNDLWTGHYFRSRVAVPADLAVNALAFCHSHSSYRTETAGPHDKEESRKYDWFFGAITDTSDAYKGRISIGSHSCPIAAVRVPIP
jgi:hypothetical protein